MPVELLRAATPWQELRAALLEQGGGRLRWGGLWGSSKALVCAALARDLRVPVLGVASDPTAADLLFDDLQTFDAGAVLLPAREGPGDAAGEVLRDRHRALERARREGFAGVVAAPLAALLQPVPDPAEETAALHLEQGMRLDPEDLLRSLVRAGFERVPAIQAPGEFARRGDIVDLLPPALGEPLRLEFFDDELESIRVFDLASQRTRHVLRHVEVPLALELPEVAGPDDSLPLDLLPPSTRVVLLEPGLIEETGRRLAVLGRQHGRALERLEAALAARPVLELATLPGADGTVDTLSVEEYCRGVAEGAALLARRAAAGERVVLCCATDAEAERLRGILADQDLNPDLLALRRGGLEKGFRIPAARLTVLHHRELVPGHGAHRPRSRARHAHSSEPLESVLALRPGDLVVHAVHGLARFRGLQGEVMELEFADQALLHVPVARVDLVERYIGAGGAAPPLDRVGSGAFARRRQKVAEAVEDMAAELLEIQARRLAGRGIAFPLDEREQRAFEAAFPWEDTPDQETGTREIHEDMGSPRPMDRLICGDVGYGKTELAARAAFRAILAGYQVALLVPTTVLAEQHARSLRERFADWPVRVEQLSRIRPPAERRRTLQDLEAGHVDLVIGTHRLLSRDVRFHRLGLVIIDEEQRFGVRAKETLKRKRATVDVLTLSATPIPRTLHMALAGLRDITSLTTPPRGRQEIHTEIRYDDEDRLVADAIRAELARGGQVFFVHNRVRTLAAVADRIQALVPEARIVLGHGQMEPRELERAMLRFVRGEADVLCCTTIVESGLDIPNANTIFIHDAHRYGLADLHQLRGRVGRADRRGHCYLLVPRGQPLPLDARRRLKAVEELRYLGAGFQVALRDLEIRGAGNLLGPEQSGHIAAVGYETYRRLLAQAVQRLKRRREVAAASEAAAETPPADVNLGVVAGLPPEYVPDEETRLQVLRELDRVRTPDEVEAALAGLRDRFGPPPPPVVHLARLFLLKHLLGHLGLEAMQRVDDHLVCSLRNARRFFRALRPAGVELRVVTPRRTHWVLPPGASAPAAALEHVYNIVAARSRPPRGRRRAGAARAAPGARRRPKRP